MRNAVFHARVEFIEERFYTLCNISCIWHVVIVDFRQQAAVYELGYHII